MSLYFVMQIQTVVVCPRGTITQRVLVVVSAKVFAAYVGVSLNVIWDHEVAYSNLFLDDLKLIQQEALIGKHYIYNPNVDQENLYNAVVAAKNGQYLVVQTAEELVHKSMNRNRYLRDRQWVYAHMLSQEISGMLLGQVNLFDAPNDATGYCFVDEDGARNASSLLRNIKVRELPMVDKSIFYVRSQEMFEYVAAVVYSRATLLVSARERVPRVLYEASRISLVPLACTRTTATLEGSSTPIVSECREALSTVMMDIPLVINPDLNKISSLL